MITRRLGASAKYPKVLITGGRAPAALELARLLAAAGCEVHAAESVRHHLCRVSKAVARSHAVPGPAREPERFVAALEEIVRREGITWLIPTCEEIFYVSAGLERLSSLCRVAAPPLEQLRRLHSKWEFIRRARELGLSVPHTERVSTPQEWARFKARIVSSPEEVFRDGYVVKPEFSRFASKVRIVKPCGREAATERTRTTGERLTEVRLEAESYPWVVQQFIPGRTLCTYSIAYEGRLAIHAAYAASYAVRGGASVYFEPLYHSGLLEWVRRFVQMERFTGQIAFDFIETERGELYAIECNPRTTSGIHLFRPEDGLVSALLQPEALGESVIEPQPHARGMLGLPMLACGLTGSRSWRAFAAWLSKYATARDVVFRWSDPRPFTEQLFLLLELRRAAAARKQTLMEASTGDIEWNGGTS
ncbi:hypothetical protein AV654_25670 [Paenibacillus elgii]|uniref:ATP-grasp domain-containing protein n=1 Tax=Paenibacillus elgii TaxID=189691 RepID=A0A163W4V4_9BACL|nr:hypothetical protein [Paenibacillus elgii]KZE75856.1 hypothetical protein AV654_25670 [Paenibacillus elgii]